MSAENEHDKDAIAGRVDPLVMPPVEGTLPPDDLRRAFVAGAKWWEYENTGFTMWNQTATAPKKRLKNATPMERKRYNARHKLPRIRRRHNVASHERDAGARSASCRCSTAHERNDSR